MRAILFAFLLVSSILQGYTQLNVISYNIRFNNPGDGVHAWPNRADDVINLLKFHQADVFCLQEALEGQVLEIDEAFQNFNYVGVGRDDGQNIGEYAPIFYNNKRFKLKKSGNFWLSESPDKPGKGWDAACNRICTWIKLKDKKTRKIFTVYNTHFDHIGVQARINASDLIIEKINALSFRKPVVLCGDFNLPPESEPIQKLSDFLHDSFKVTELPPHGSVSTWAGFTYDAKQGERIDYIFVSDEIRVLRYSGLTDSRDRQFFSDHLPVFVELDF